MGRLLASLLAGVSPLALAALVHCDVRTASAASNDAGIDADAAFEEPDLPLIPATKVDLLFAIDNSSSMHDKGALLASSVSTILRRKAPRVMPLKACVGITGGGVNDDISAVERKRA